MRIAPLVRALLHGGGRDGRHLRLERQIQLRHERPPAGIAIDGQVNRRDIASKIPLLLIFIAAGLEIQDLQGKCHNFEVILEATSY